MPVISFLKQNRKLTVESGANLREAAIKEYLSVYPHLFKILNCRGNSMCGTCAVEIVSGEVDPPGEKEQRKIKGRLKKNPTIRLACQVAVKGDLEVRTHI
ncbi:MAG: 2Fe-2S iron-sulfur cluster-binding protein [Nitrospinota bacterium]|nr:2Fe-2S iron-sulfur cluster-binding protein [Nitrospinota bacterium]